MPIKKNNETRPASTMVTFDVSDDFFGAVWNCAIRYCLGRRSYMPRLVIDFIRPSIPLLSNKTLWCMERDISQARNGGLGDPDIDEPVWLRFLNDIQKEINRRKEQAHENQA